MFGTNLTITSTSFYIPVDTEQYSIPLFAIGTSIHMNQVLDRFVNLISLICNIYFIIAVTHNKPIRQIVDQSCTVY